MQADDEVRLRHILEAARDAQRFLAGKCQEDLKEDRMLLFAVVKAVEIIGEAARQISADGRARLPSVAWPDVVGMRHRLVHAYYYDINAKIVWQTVQEDLPPLVSEVTRVLGDSL